MAVKLPQHGGEGKEAYKGTKTDMKLPQMGGEGKKFGKGTDTKLLLGSKDDGYCGPGRYLNTE